MGNKLKHEVKALAYHEIGSALDNQLESAQREQSGFEGAKQALVSAKLMVEALTANVDADLKENVLDMDQAKLAKRWVLRSAGLLENLALKVEVQKYQAQGKIIALRQAVKDTNALYLTEKSSWEEAEKADSAVVGEEDEDPRRPTARASGVHPGDPLGDRREGPEEPKVEEAEGPEEPKVEPKVKSTRIKKGWSK